MNVTYTLCVKTSPYFFKWKFTGATQGAKGMMGENYYPSLKITILNFFWARDAYYDNFFFSFSYSGYTRDTRLPRMTCKAANRWHVDLTLLRNPSLIKHRKQGGQRVLYFESLGSINNGDLSALV